MEKRKCTQCRKSFIPSRNPDQQFCSNRTCQSARKQSWRQKKCRSDLDYRENQNYASRKWRKKNTDYWRHYRDTHPAYTENNRRQQCIRKQAQADRVCKSDVLQFANSDAIISKSPIKTGTYKLIPEGASWFANSDALTVKISFITNG